MKVEMLVTTGEGQLVAGTVSFEKGQLVVEANKNYVLLMKSLLEEPLQIGTDIIDPMKEPIRWMRALPMYYTGTYLRAQFYL